jgi:hypothetical protein
MPVGEVFVFLMMSIVAISLIIAVVITRRNVVKARHTERMAMIDKGMDPDQSLLSEGGVPNVPTWMKVGSSITGIGAGFVIGGVLSGWFPHAEEAMTFGSVLFMGGAGLSLPYFLSAYFQTHGDKIRN